MNQSSACEQRLRDLLGTDLPANELRRLAHADTQLRLAAAHDRDRAARADSAWMENLWGTAGASAGAPSQMRLRRKWLN